MDTWKKYIKQSFKQDLNQINVPEAIAYANMLMGKIAWKAIHNKKSQRLYNKFFEVASLILHATSVQHTYTSEYFNEILKHIDDVLSKLKELDYNSAQIGLILGNLSEYTDTHYTFTELIAFIQFLAAQN